MSTTFAANPASPPILLFLLGLAAILVRSNLELPEPVPRLLATYLSMALGVRAASSCRRAASTRPPSRTLLAALAMAAVVPVAGRRLVRFGMPSRWLPVFSVAMPLLNAAIAAAVGRALSLSAGDAFLFSCSTRARRTLRLPPRCGRRFPQPIPACT